MKKTGLILLALTSLLVFGTTMNVMAAEGWVMESGHWVYYESNGNRATNTWKKGADNLFRYVDGNGQMVLNSWVDDMYYVDANGILTTDKWLKLRPSGWTSYDDDEYGWFYFGSSGKALSDTWKKINDKWYYFDDIGMMQTGWLEDTYYLGAGEDGVMRTGWQYLPDPEEDDDDDRVTPGDEGDDGHHWYYFGTNGKKYTPDLSGGQEHNIIKIAKNYYCFDSNGAMQTGWQNVSEDPDSEDIGDYRFFGEANDGKMRTGWLYAAGPEDVNGSMFDTEEKWYYFGTNGIPKVGPREGHASTSDLVRVNGITYLFNEYGNPVYGLQNVEGYAYYFGNETQLSMQTGKQTVEEGDGSKCVYYFTDSGSGKGRGYTGIKDDYLYYNGKRQDAGDSRYMIVTIPTSGGETTYVVNSTGKIQKNKTSTDAYGTKFRSNAKGILIKVNDEVAGSGDTGEPIAPNYAY